MATAIEQALEQALLDEQIFGDPQGFIAPELSQLMPAHPGSVGPYLNVGVFPDPQTATQQAPWGGAQERGNISPLLGFIPRVTGSDLQRDIDMTDLLYAAGILNAEDSGWKSTVDTGDIPGHAMSSDTYGQQLGVKAALRKEANPLMGSGVTNLAHQVRARVDPIHDPLLPSKRANTQRAIDAYNAALVPQYGWEGYRPEDMAAQQPLPARSAALAAGAYPGQDYGPTGENLGEFPTMPGQAYGPTPEQYLRSVEMAGETGKQIIPKNFPIIGTPSKQFMPEYLESTGPEPEYGSSVWHTDPAFEEAITRQYDPAEFGLDPFTREQVSTSSNFLANLMAEGTEAQKTAIQRAISPGTSGILRENLAAHFARDDAESPFTVDPSTGETYEFASRAPIDMAKSTGVGADPGIEIITEPTVAPAISREQEIENMMIEDRASQLKFHPSSPLYEAPFEEGTGPEAVSPEQPMAQAVTQALANTGQPVQQNLQALAALAQTDPDIAERYVPGSQALQDITTQVESFSEPTVEWTPPKKKEVKKVKKGPTREEKSATRLANQAANRKLLAEKQEARDIKKAENAAIRAEKLAARESAKQARDRKAAEKALAIQREHEKMARVEELKRHEQMLRFADESRKAYLARKKQEDELREVQGYGWGGMFT